MALSENEKLLLESYKDHLKSDLFPKSDPKATNDNNFEMRGFEYHRGHINEMFALKAADLTHHDGICAAFSKVHNYKYLSDPHFNEALEKEFDAQAIPKEEQHKALEYIPKIINELKEEAGAWAEKDSGWHPDLNGIMQTVTGLQQFEE